MKTIGTPSTQVRELNAVANGVLPNGQPVVVNADGTVSVIAGAAEGFGAAATFESSSTFNSATFDSTSNKVVIAYNSSGNGKAVVGTVSDRTISFGTPVVFESAASNYIAATFDSNSNKIVIAYQDGGNSGYTTAIVGTVSGTSISFGTAVVVKSAYANWVSATFDSGNNKVVVAIDRYAFVGTVSGTTISFGAQTDYGSGTATSYVASTFDTNSNKAVLCYTRGSFCRSRVGTVSGTSISFGAEAYGIPFPTGGSENGITFDSNSNKIVIISLAGNVSKAAVGTVSGTSISFGTPVPISGNYQESNRLVFDSSENKVIAFWKDGSNSYKGTYAVGTVSGTSISFTSNTVFTDGATSDFTTTFDSNSNNAVVSYVRSGAKASVFGFESTTLTSENYIGLASSGYPDTAGATIDVQGAINDRQSGLTAGQSYYVQTDGTLDTTPASPSVFAGTAISATKIIVKG